VYCTKFIVHALTTVDFVTFSLQCFGFGRRPDGVSQRYGAEEVRYEIVEEGLLLKV
jgi:hypothetical protein